MFKNTRAASGMVLSGGFEGENGATPLSGGLAGQWALNSIPQPDPAGTSRSLPRPSCIHNCVKTGRGRASSCAAVPEYPRVRQWEHWTCASLWWPCLPLLPGIHPWPSSPHVCAQILVSYPRSGNSLLRKLLERVTGVVTGSDTRPDRVLSRALLRNGLKVQHI